MDVTKKFVITNRGLVIFLELASFLVDGVSVRNMVESMDAMSLVVANFHKLIKNVKKAKPT